MGQEALHATKVLRHLLKFLKKHIGQEDYKKHFTDFVTKEFKKNHQISDPSSIQTKLKLARDYTFMLYSVQLHHHKELLFSYNIAVDRSEEMKRVLGKSAASVGLQPPDVYQP